MIVVESKHVRLAVDELGHHLFQFVAVHLAVADDDARVRHQRCDAFGHGVDVDDAVVQVKNLASAIELALDGVANDALVVLRDDGFDGQTVLRRRFDRAHVARAGEREIERARNRRGAEREHIDELAQQFEFLLVHHAEALLLVDDDQAEIFELDVALHAADACR